MDEYRFYTIPNKILRVFAQKGNILVRKISFVERGQTVTIIVRRMFLTGIFVIWGINFARQRITGIISFRRMQIITYSGYMNTYVFID